MVAESSLEFPFSSYDAGVSHVSRLEITEASRQRTEVYHGRARMGRLESVNYTLEMPLDYVSSDIFDVHVNGLIAAKPSYRRVREAGAQLGKSGISLAAHQGLPVFDLLSPRGVIDTERYRQRAVSAVLDDVQSIYGDEVRFRLKGHSTGGRTSTAVAEDSPERIEGVTLVNSAGLVKGQTTLDYLRRLPAFHREEVEANWDILRHDFARPGVLADFLRYNLGNVVRTGVEALSISRADITERVVALGDLGIKVAILDAAADRLTPNASVRDGVGSFVDLYRMHPNLAIGHLGPQVHPLELAMEYHAIDRALDPREVLPARLVSIRALERRIHAERVAA